MSVETSRCKLSYDVVKLASVNFLFFLLFMSNSIPSKTHLPQNPPIGPDPLSDEKLNLILKNEFPERKIVNSSFPTDTFIMKKRLYRQFFSKW